MTGYPHAIDRLTGPVLASAVARLCLVSAYLVGGLDKLSDLPAAYAETAHFGLQPAWLWAWATIGVELAGSALVLSGRLVWLGAAMLALFTLAASVLANAFWTMQGAARFAAFNAFFEHLGLIGGFILAAMVVARDRSGAPR